MFSPLYVKIALFDAKKGVKYAYYPIFIAILYLKIANFDCFDGFQCRVCAARRQSILENTENYVFSNILVSKIK